MKRTHKCDCRALGSNDTYRKRWDEIFKKKGSVVNTEHSYVSREYTKEEQKLLDEIEDRNGF